MADIVWDYTTENPEIHVEDVFLGDLDFDLEEADDLSVFASATFDDEGLPLFN